MVLDYVFSHSRRPIELPDQAAIQALANGVIQKMFWPEASRDWNCVGQQCGDGGNDWYFLLQLCCSLLTFLGY